MLCSVVIGVLSPDRKIYKTTMDEVLYEGTLSIQGSEYPIVGYDTALHEGNAGKVEVACYLRSEKVKGSLYTYLMAVTVTAASPDAEETSEFTVKGLLVKRADLSADLGKGTEVQNFIMRYRAEDGNQNLVHAVARGCVARKLNRRQLNAFITVSGILRLKRHRLELEAKEVN